MKCMYFKAIAFCFILLVMSTQEIHAATSIPHILHFIHLSNEEISDSEIRNIQDWIEKNEGFAVQLWSSADVKSLPLSKVTVRNIQDLKRGKDLLSHAFDPSLQSEVALYAVLLQEGGVVVDEAESRAVSLDPLMDKCDLFCSADEDAQRYGSRIVGAAPGHPLLRKTVDMIFAEKIADKNLTVQKVARAFKNAVDESIFDKNMRCITIPSSAFSRESGMKENAGHNVTSTVFEAKEKYQNDFERLMNTSMTGLKVKSKQFLSYFSAIMALALGFVITLAAIVFKIKKRYFS